MLGRRHLSGQRTNCHQWVFAQIPSDAEDVAPWKCGHWDHVFVLQMQTGLPQPRRGTVPHTKADCWWSAMGYHFASANLVSFSGSHTLGTAEDINI